MPALIYLSIIGSCLLNKYKTTWLYDVYLFTDLNGDYIEPKKHDRYMYRYISHEIKNHDRLNYTISLVVTKTHLR